MKAGARAPRATAERRPLLSPAPLEDDKDDGGDRVPFPELADLMGRLHFSTTDGRIWLDDQRMLLVHASALGMLRKEMIENLGMDVARGFMTRMGYHAGISDARLARKIRTRYSIQDMFAVGPQMHCLEGIGMSQAVRMECDVDKGTHYGEFLWTSPVEDEEHIRHFSIGTEPACWMQIGYASGYSTEFMGRQILYREVECQSMGHQICRIVGKPVEEWGPDAAQDLRFLLADALRPGGQPLAPRPSCELILPRGENPQPDMPVGISSSFKAVMHLVRKVAPTRATVLFLGESGVGKEVFSRTLHRLGNRADKPFVAVNCAAIPEQLIESELFGVERGAFTGALQSRLGRFERANGGTLFLDEIGTLTASAQGKLLRALQEGEIERLGDSQTRKVDVRVIAATNVDLRDEVKAGRFREDLFFRLNVFPVRIIPLRERREDIPLLMNHFLNKFNARHERRQTGFTQRAVDAMLSYDWPGNIREMENVIERGVILAPEDGAIDSPHLFTSGERFTEQRFAINRDGKLIAVDPSTFIADLTQEREVERVSRGVNSLLLDEDAECDQVSLDEIETLLLKRAIERAQGNVAAAARLLGITRPQMLYRLKSRGIMNEGE